jgi:hypothetical protein
LQQKLLLKEKWQKSKMTDYQKILEEFRTHYRNKYNISFDDEILYFFIRVNEMQTDLKKDIRKLPKITFKTGKDYFFYGLGRSLIPSLLVIVIISAIFFTAGFHNQSYQFMIPAKIYRKDSIHYLELKTSDTDYYLQIQKNKNFLK